MINASEKEVQWGTSRTFACPPGPLGSLLLQNMQQQYVQVNLPGEAGSRVWRAMIFVSLSNSILFDAGSVLGCRFGITLGVGKAQTTFFQDITMTGPTGLASNFAKLDLEFPARSISIVQTLFNYSNVNAGQQPLQATVGAFVAPQQPMYLGSVEDKQGKAYTW
jgi:hypothetical protein